MKSLARSNQPGAHQEAPRAKPSDSKLPPGTNYCRCANCGSYFGGLKTFEIHRIGPARDRACLGPGVLRDGHNRPVLRLSDRGYWVRAFGKRPPKLRLIK